MDIACASRCEARPASARVRPTPRYISAIACVLVNVHGELIDPRPPWTPPTLSGPSRSLPAPMRATWVLDALWSSHFDGTSTRCLSTSCTAKHAAPLLALVRRGLTRPAWPAISCPVVLAFCWPKARAEPEEAGDRDALRVCAWPGDLQASRARVVCETAWRAVFGDRCTARARCVCIGIDAVYCWACGATR